MKGGKHIRCSLSHFRVLPSVIEKEPLFNRTPISVVNSFHDLLWMPETACGKELSIQQTGEQNKDHKRVPFYVVYRAVASCV